MHIPPWALILVVVLIVLIGYGLYVYLPIRHAIAVSKVIQNDAVAYEQHPANPTEYILVTGDSTAVGTGAIDPKLSTAGRLGAQFPTADITNSSQNGLQLAGLEQKLATLPRDHYDLILMQIGANDIVGFTPQSKISTELNAVLMRAQQLSPHTVLVTSGNVGLSPVFRWPLTTLLSYKTRQVRTLFIQTVAKYPSVTYVDLYKNKADEPFGKNIPLYYAADHFHPSGAGYGLWYQDIEPVIVGSTSGEN